MKKIFLSCIAFASLLFLSVNCNKKTEELNADSEANVQFDLAKAKTEIEANYTEFENAFNAKDSVALANCYTADAKFMPANEKAVVGRAAIQKTFAMWFQGDMPKIDVQLVELWGNENSLTAENAWTMTGKDGKVIDQGKSLEVYKKEEGKWKMQRDCFNSDMPALPPPPPAPKK